MRGLYRNRKPFYYSLYGNKVAYVDDDGYETGEIKVTYYDPVKCYGNISASKGTAEIDQFGTDISYDKVIVLYDLNCPIDENTVLYIDARPRYDGFDYRVVRVAKSLNSISIAIEKVR